MTLVDRISHLDPCSGAVEWLDGYSSAKAAWADCQRPDWMLWLIGKTTKSEPWSDERKSLVACALDCAETVKHLWPEKQKEKIANGIAVLRDWIVGEATVERAKEARRSLAAAYAAAYADAAAYAAAAAADAAYAAAAADAADAAAADAAYAAAAAAADAADAAYAAAYAAAEAANAARAAMKRQCADIIRKHFPKPPMVRRPKDVVKV